MYVVQTDIKPVHSTINQNNRNHSFRDDFNLKSPLADDQKHINSPEGTEGTLSCHLFQSKSHHVTDDQVSRRKELNVA